MVKYTPEQRISAFWNKVNKNGSIPAHCPELGRCWEWTASCVNGGYGKFLINSKYKNSHRIAWELVNGEIPKDLWVLHTCDNPACVNPSHLFLGTQQDNIDDMMSKKRYRAAKGENHYHRKSTVEEVEIIRQRYAAGGITQKQLSVITGLSVSQIWRIIKHKTDGKHEIR